MEMVYCCTPSRLKDRTMDICRFVAFQGNAPFHPFLAFPYELYECNHLIGRERTMKYCCDAVRCIKGCGHVGVFGISEGVLKEVVTARESGILVVSYKSAGFDSLWDDILESMLSSASEQSSIDALEFLVA